MRLRVEIERLFGGHAFSRPLFYAYPGGLRFELSEGGTSIDQFLLAIVKAREICDAIFKMEQPYVACLRMRAGASAPSHRDVIRELRSAGVTVSRDRCIWLEPVPLDDRFDEELEEFWVNVAFETSAAALQGLLWCAFASDFKSIRPRPACDIYLFELTKGVMVWPYDDRGMDVVGPNHDFLATLYKRFNHYLLEYDLTSMKDTFEAL
jgi:hypothetical protein